MVFDVETDSTRNKLQREIINTTLERYNKEVPNPAVAYAQNGGLAGLDGGGGGGSVIASSLETDYLDFGTQNGLQALNIFLLAGDKKYIRRITLANNNPLAFAISTENFVIDRITELYVIFVQDDTGGRQLALPSAVVYHNAHLLNFNLDKTAGAETTFRFSTTDAGVTWHIELVGLSAAAAGVSTIADATDTQIASPQNNQILTYDDGLSKWLPKNIAQIISLEPNEYGDIDVQEFLTNLPSTVWENITGLADAIENIGNDLWDAIGDVGMLVQEYLEGLSRTTWEEFTNFGDAVIDIGNGIWQTAEGVLEDIENWYTTTDNPAIVWIRDTLDGPIRTAITTASDFVTQFTADPYGTLTDLGKGIQDQVTAWWNSIDIEPINTIRTVLNSDAVRTAFGTAVTFFEGLGDGIADAIEDAGEFFGDPAAIPEKVIEYLLGTSSRAARFVTRLFNSGTLVVDNILRDLFGSGVEDVNSWLQGRKTDIITALGDAGTWLSNITGPIGERIVNASEWVAAVGTSFEDGVNNLLGDINNHISNLAELVTDLISGATDALGNLSQNILNFLGLTQGDIIPPVYGDGTGGGGNVSFPLLYGENQLNEVGNQTQVIDLSGSNAHIHTMTLIGDAVLVFTNLPESGKRVFFQLEITQGGDGFHEISFSNNPNYTVQARADVGTQPDTTTIINGYADHDSIFMANFGSRITNIIQGGGSGGGGLNNLSDWAHHKADTAIDVDHNQINKVGAMLFSQFSNSDLSSILPRREGIDIRAGNNNIIRLMSSNVEVLAEFAEGYIDFKRREIRNFDFDLRGALSPLSITDFNNVFLSANQIENSVLKYDYNGNLWFNAPISFDEIVGNITGSQILNGTITANKIQRFAPNSIITSDGTGILATNTITRTQLNDALSDYPFTSGNIHMTVDSRLEELENNAEITLSNITGVLNGVKLLDNSVPIGKLEDFDATEEILATDTTGNIINTHISRPTFVAAFTGLNTDGGSLEQRLAALEEGSSSGGGSSFDPLNIVSALLPQNQPGPSIGHALLRFSAGHFENLHAYSNIFLGGDINHSGSKIGFRGADKVAGKTWLEVHTTGNIITNPHRQTIPATSESNAANPGTIVILLRAFRTLILDLKEQGILL